MDEAVDGTELAPWDIYREIHKGLRLALFTTTTRAGNADPADRDDVDRLTMDWAETAFVLRGHHDHERDFVDPVIAVQAPALRDDVEAGHAAADRAIAGLDDLAGRLLEVPDTHRAALLQRVHLALSALTALYLEHMAFEEERVMPALQAALSDTELMELTVRIRLSVPPPDMCTFIKYMVPAMHPGERAEMFEGIHALAPAEIFELFRGAAEQALGPTAYESLAARAGFAEQG